LKEEVPLFYRKEEKASEYNYKRCGGKLNQWKEGENAFHD